MNKQDDVIRRFFTTDEHGFSQGAIIVAVVFLIITSICAYLRLDFSPLA